MIDPFNVKRWWDVTQQPLKERLSVLPFGQYEDGSVGLAFPQLLAAPVEGMQNFGRYGYDTPEAIRDNAISAFDVAGGAVTGGLGVGLAGGLADDAVRALPKPSLDDMPAQAAFKWGDDIYTGEYHGNAIRSAVDAHGMDAINSAADVSKGTHGWGDLEGFKTIGGDFLTREQAADAIRRSGLVKGEAIPNELHANRLNDYRKQGLWANAPTGSSVPLAVNALERAQPQGIRAYHGSPHDFDRFSLDKIGTGEGAQAYGHGLYFADSEDVARSYRDTLGANKAWKSQDIRDAEPALAQKLVEMGYPEDVAASVAQTARLEHTMNTPDANLQKLYGTRDETFQNALRDAWSMRENVFGGPTGRMYEVNIKANPEDFLDWDKPLPAQPDFIQSTLDPLVRVPFSGSAGDLMRNTVDINQLVDLRSPSVVSQLREAGIPGIRYLDGMSRDGGAGTSNYVVFDDQIIDILRKYANPPTGAIPGLAGTIFDDENDLPVLRPLP